VALAGGHLKNPLLVRLYRDALGADAVLTKAAEPVLLGTAMVAAVAAGLYADLFEALDRMAPEQNVLPRDSKWALTHDIAYRIYRKLFDVRNQIDADARALTQPPISVA
jgi:ribulose kinase